MKDLTKNSLTYKVDEIMSKMTLDEKFSQLIYTSKEIEHLDIPAYNWWNECLHGVAHAGRATVFPQAIGLAATFNFSLIKEVAGAIADEGRIKHQQAVEAGDWGDPYKGLTFWTPNVNIFRDPRWGRGQETYGEDPWLTSQIGIGFVQGLQGDDPKYLKTSACAKHYAVHSGPEKHRHSFNAVVSKQDLAETYLPAFKALVDAGVEAVMGAYNAVNGEPSCVSSFLIEETLRKKWGFKGHVVSDCWAIRDLHEYYKIAKDEIEAAAMALNAGCDLNCGCTYEHIWLKKAFDKGLLDMETIDTSLRRLLSTRAKLGILTKNDENPYSNTPKELLLSDKHRSLAYKSAAESVVLLKNDGILPLKKSVRNILVAGPNATEVQSLMGNYSSMSPRMTTILEGIVGSVDDGVAVRVNPGCMFDSESLIKSNWFGFEVRSADVVIAVCGLTTILEGEEGGALRSENEGDRNNLTLPDSQLEFLNDLVTHGTPVILVLTGGSAISLPEIHKKVAALLYTWYPGEAGGDAVGDIICGKENTSGRMPITVPMSEDDLPAFDDYSMNNRTYRYSDKTPMYPFGFGLSYTQFKYDNSLLSWDGGKGFIKAEITNTGSFTGTETVQLYIKPPVTEDMGYPLFSLKGVQKIQLKPGESKIVRFNLGKKELSFADKSGELRIVKGEYKIYLGSSLPVKRSIELGAPQPVEISLNIK